ncbi:PilZ domain-containing protein [Novosphingobium sp. PS1R-30]|uniref:PilZ domain-containing protein n=1 Tax=Novosphingobium anseongense TaxID=3133436 RepID=A0ABU8RZ91_9SPHN
MTSPRFGCNDGLSLAARMSDRREQRRIRAPRVVQVAHDGAAAYARCRDFSDTGMKLDLTVPLQLNDMVTVALSSSVMLCGSVAWVRGRECGVVFDGTVDSDALLDAVEPQAGVVASPATLNLLHGRRWPGDGRPTPPAGGKPDARFQAGLAVTVMIGPNEEQRGVVRWASGNIAAFELAPGAEPSQPLLPAPSH